MKREIAAWFVGLATASLLAGAVVGGVAYLIAT